MYAKSSMNWYKLSLIVSSGIAANVLAAIIAEVLSGLTLPINASDDPNISLVYVIVASINCCTWND